MVNIEIRKLIVENRRDGRKIEEIARIFHVSEPTVKRILKRERETGNVEPSYENSGRRSEITPEQLKKMEQLVISHPDITLAEIKEEMHLSIKKSQISNILRNKLKFNYKKNVTCQ